MARSRLSVEVHPVFIIGLSVSVRRRWRSPEHNLGTIDEQPQRD